MAVSPILYGLVHFLAWDDQFPTLQERLLWRVSSFVVTFSGLMGFAAAIFIGWSVEVFKFLKPAIEVLAALTLVVMIPLVHVLASGFLIAESFRQLFFLDPAVYQLPSWSNYWPHLT
jgi:ABC-type nitrate/sulfonate/bicarbonate transport system permease component